MPSKYNLKERSYIKSSKGSGETRKLFENKEWYCPDHPDYYTVYKGKCLVCGKALQLKGIDK